MLDNNWLGICTEAQGVENIIAVMKTWGTYKVVMKTKQRPFARLMSLMSGLELWGNSFTYCVTILSVVLIEDGATQP